MSFNRLTQDISFISKLADKPNQAGMSAAELKAEFDKAGNALKIFINGFLDSLEGNTGASNIGIQPIAGLSANKVQTALSELYSKATASIGTAAIEDSAVTTDKIRNAAVVTSKIADGNITRGKLAKEALFSPSVLVNESTRTVTAADIGCTLQNSWNADVTYKITQAESESMPRGSEIAFIRAGSSASLTVSIKGEGVRLGIVGDKYYSNATVKIEDFLGIVAIRKVASDIANGDLWVVIGNVEVVS